MKSHTLTSALFLASCLLLVPAIPVSGQTSSQSTSPKQEEAKALLACAQMVVDELGVLKIPRCARSSISGQTFGGYRSLPWRRTSPQFRGTPWVDWSNYWGTGDMTSLPTGFISSKLPAQRGVAGALVDLELQRVELIKFNLFDNSGTYSHFVEGRNGVAGPALKVWPEMTLAADKPLVQGRRWRWSAGLQR